MALVRAKRQEFLEELDIEDPRELMSSEMTKWEKVSLSLNRADGISCFRTAEACKYKWQQLLPDYKKVADLHKGTGTNSMLYFDLSFAERRDRVLPKNFDAFVYREMHEWLRHKPTMNPPHFRDLLHPDDGNLRAAAEENVPEVQSPAVDEQHRPRSDSTLHAYTSVAAYDFAADSYDEWDNPAEETHASGGGNDMQSTFPSPVPLTASSVQRSRHTDFSASAPTSPRPSTVPGPRNNSHNVPDVRGTQSAQVPVGQSPSPCPTQGRGQSSQRRPGQGMGGQVPAYSGTTAAPAVGARPTNPQLLSSSDTSAGRSRKPLFGNTGVRRKTNHAIKLVADATVEGSDKLVAGLKEINDSARDMKKQQMEMELTMHADNMRYKEKKDEQVLENARLALVNQGAIAAAMCTLADAIRGSRMAASASAPEATTEQGNETGAAAEAGPANTIPPRST
jgi:hypothetical protein